MHIPTYHMCRNTGLRSLYTWQCTRIIYLTSISTLWKVLIITNPTPRVATRFRGIWLELLVECGHCHVEAVGLTDGEAWSRLGEQARHRQHFEALYIKLFFSCLNAANCTELIPVIHWYYLYWQGRLYIKLNLATLISFKNHVIYILYSCMQALSAHAVYTLPKPSMWYLLICLLLSLRSTLPCAMRRQCVSHHWQNILSSKCGGRRQICSIVSYVKYIQILVRSEFLLSVGSEI